MLSAAFIVCGLSLLLLSFLVVYSNPRARTNRALSSFLFSGFLWLFANLLANISSTPEKIILYSRLALVGAILIAPSYLLFCYYFAFANSSKKLSGKKLAFVFLIPTVLLITTPTPLNIKGLASNNVDVLVGPTYTLLVPLLLLYFGYGTYLLIRMLRKTDSVKKRQLNYIFFGIALTFIPGLILNGALLLLGYSESASYGPLFVIFFSVFTSLAIVKHKFLDIRLIVARSLGYLLSLGALIAAYGGLTYLITEMLSLVAKGSNNAKVIDIVLLAAAATSYAGVKRFFDKVTNRFFYRDAYEPQKFLDELNEVLVVNIELEKLLTDTAYVIQQNLKTDFCVFTIRETSYFPRRFVGDPGKKFSAEDIEEISQAHAHIHDKVIVADYLGNEDRELKRILDKNDISILVRLVPTLDYEIQGLGHILFGAKKSGNPFNKQDLQILEIIANELVIAVQNGLRFEEIEKFNATLQEKIDDATHKLKKTNEKLQALDETKDEFISMASHQLRTPLTSVKGYLSMVLEGDAGETNEMQKKLLDQAFVSSQRMVYLIADLLNVSRLRTGKFVIDAIPTNLAEVIDSETGQLKETAKARGLKLIYDKPEKFPTLMLDETKIRQVIMNFMDNAIYYAKPNGTVKVELNDTGKSVEFMVIDDGIGVPKSEQHHLFTKFYRAGNAKKARPDGTGLGLFMAKKVIVAQGGSIIFRSEEGKGSTFGFSFAKDKLSPSTDPTDTKA